MDLKLESVQCVITGAAPLGGYCIEEGRKVRKSDEIVSLGRVEDCRVFAEVSR